MNSLQNPDDSPEHLLTQARVGCTDALGRLLELYRNYLRLLARTQIDLTLRVRLDSSDLVQETLLEAFRDFRQFAGSTEKELVAWLRRILVRNLADQVKHHKAQARNWGRQESLEALLDRSSSAAEQALARGISTPSAQAARREQAVLLADALARLPPDYREVIVLRNLEHLKFEEIATRMNRSVGAARMLWSRALEKLSCLMEARS
jgi:RNA polymerase sigma-70 factor (ECF subfamily)